MIFFTILLQCGMKYTLINLKKSLRRRDIYLFLSIHYEKYSIFEGQTLDISQNIINLITETATHTCKNKNKKENKEKESVQ